MPRGSEEGGHLTALAGYDDGKDWTILRNSWGIPWGDGGYGYIPYQYLTNPKYAGDFWEIETVLA